MAVLLRFYRLLHQKCSGTMGQFVRDKVGLFQFRESVFFLSQGPLTHILAVK